MSLVTITHFMARTGAIFVVVPLLVHDRLDLNAAQIGLALTLGNAVNLAMMPAAGIMVDRFGRRPLIIPGALLSGVAFAAFARRRQLPELSALPALGLRGRHWQLGPPAPTSPWPRRWPTA